MTKSVAYNLIQRGEIWWCDLPAPIGDRPVLVLQADKFNFSKIGTTIIATISSDLELLKSSDNVLLKAEDFGLYKDSVVKVAQILTVEKETLYEKEGKLSAHLMKKVEQGLYSVLCL